MSKDQHKKAVKVEASLALTEEGSYASGFGILTLSAGILTSSIPLLAIRTDSICPAPRDGRDTGGLIYMCLNIPGHILGELWSGAFCRILKSHSHIKCTPYHFIPLCYHKMCDCVSTSTYRASIIMAVFPEANGF